MEITTTGTKVCVKCKYVVRSVIHATLNKANKVVLKLSVCQPHLGHMCQKHSAQPPGHSVNMHCVFIFLQ